MRACGSHVAAAVAVMLGATAAQVPMAQAQVAQAQVAQAQVTQAQVTQAQVAQAQVTQAQVTQAQVPAAKEDLPPLELGRIPHFASEAAANRACRRDAVVWADSESGYFYPRWHPKYGKTADGSFTCLRDATRADYWNINPFTSNPEQGRAFPIDPSLLDFGT